MYVNLFGNGWSASATPPTLRNDYSRLSKKEEMVESLSITSTRTEI
jgi:nucleoside diphosphate kinase